MTLSGRQATALRAVTDPAHALEPGPALPWSLLEAVRTVVGADEVELDQTDPQQGWLGFMQSVTAHTYVSEEPDDPHYWELWWGKEANVEAQFRQRVRATLLSDFIPHREWRRQQIYVEYVRPEGLFHELGVNLPEPEGRFLRLHCWRTPGRDFGERERLLLDLLRPHLVAAFRTAELHRHPLPLTPRQRELLDLVAGGLTNRQVSRAMALSEGTVRRHLNNIFERLGVASRTQAVMQAAARHPGD